MKPVGLAHKIYMFKDCYHPPGDPPAFLCSLNTVHKSLLEYLWVSATKHSSKIFIQETSIDRINSLATFYQSCFMVTEIILHHLLRLTEIHWSNAHMCLYAANKKKCAISYLHIRSSWAISFLLILSFCKDKTPKCTCFMLKDIGTNFVRYGFEHSVRVAYTA